MQLKSPKLQMCLKWEPTSSRSAKTALCFKAAAHPAVFGLSRRAAVKSADLGAAALARLLLVWVNVVLVMSHLSPRQWQLRVSAHI